MNISATPACHTRLWKLWAQRYCGHDDCCCIPSQHRRYVVAHFIHKEHHQTVQNDPSVDCGFEFNEDDLRRQMLAMLRRP